VTRPDAARPAPGRIIEVELPLVDLAEMNEELGIEAV
jgi:hypothetical protein